MTETPGLRERKKARTRWAIQEEALKLFREQGYQATTIDQIAAAADISPSTFFRYFPTKEDVVLYDQFDPQLIEAFLAQPAELSPVAAVRRAMQLVFEQAPAAETEREFQRHELARSVPELRARMLDGFVSGLELFADALAKRTGRRTDDPAVRTLAGAIIGIGLAAMLTGDGRPEEFFERFDAQLALLEAGLEL